MSKLPVALQLYTVRDLAEKDPAGIIKQVKEMGYDGVELAGFFGLTPEALKEILDANGLTAVSAHVSTQELNEGIEAAVARYKGMGCKYIAIPFLVPELRPGAADYDKTVNLIQTVGKLCNENGMTLLYHNHDFEFEKVADGRFALDYMYETIPADILQTEIDTCWVKVAGQDPAAYVRKYAGRCPVVHLKDYFLEGDMYDDSQPGKRSDKFEFRPVGYGAQDFPAILAASEESGASWVVVEQDRSVGRTSIEAARLSREYLRSIGW